MHARRQCLQCNDGLAIADAGRGAGLLPRHYHIEHLVAVQEVIRAFSGFDNDDNHSPIECAGMSGVIGEPRLTPTRTSRQRKKPSARSVRRGHS